MLKIKMGKIREDRGTVPYLFFKKNDQEILEQTGCCTPLKIYLLPCHSGPRVGKRVCNSLRFDYLAVSVTSINKLGYICVIEIQARK